MLFNIRFVSYFFDSSFSYGRPSKEREREREESSQCCSIDTDALAREMRIQSKFSSFNFISTWRVRGHFFSRWISFFHLDLIYIFLLLSIFPYLFPFIFIRYVFHLVRSFGHLESMVEINKWKTKTTKVFDFFFRSSFYDAYAYEAHIMCVWIFDVYMISVEASSIE